ncbi:MAG: hypothetical protein LBB68_08820 [Treponema sp.]|nr:hypothetical protein [Treponema sp.]
MPHHDWIPSKESDFQELVSKWETELADSAKRTAYGWVAEECERVLALLTDFTVKRAAYASVDSTENRIAKDAALKAAADAMRDFANTSIRYNHRMSPDAKKHMGVDTRDKTITEVPVPKGFPVFFMRNSDYRKLRFELHEEGSERRAIPDNYNGAVCYYALDDAPVTDESRLVMSQLLNTALFDWQFGPEADGKVFSCILKWETHSGKQGPPSPVQSIKIW